MKYVPLFLGTQVSALFQLIISLSKNVLRDVWTYISAQDKEKWGWGIPTPGTNHCLSATNVVKEVWTFIKILELCP